MVTLPGYKIDEKLYESGNSLVYRGRRETDGTGQGDAVPVVLKILKHDYPTPEQIARFKREYEVTRKLDADGVIKVYGLEKHQHSLAMILEDFGGESLAKLLPTRPLDLADFLRLAIHITGGLANIHQQHLMHKDINPSNVVWNPDTDQLKIIDFGIATALSQENPEVRNPNVLEGTLAYLSPEQTGRMNRAIDYRTDFYSLGVTFYEMLIGQLPFQTTDAMELVHVHLAQTPPPPSALKPDIPPVLSQIVMKLMSKTAEERYQSAFGLQADLQHCLTQVQDLSGLSFELGQHDISDRFQVSQKLYGREQEIETLLAAFERIATTDGSQGDEDNLQSPISQSPIELLLVAGYSGIGKSVLVHEVHKPITEKRGYFIAGKFDQFQRNIPYTALIQAFQALIRQILSESEAQINRWQETLLQALGPNGQVIVEIIPEVELIIGPQPEIPDLPPTESQNHFNLVFQNFVRALATAEHPLVIFLDDLQWADSSSLKLIELFMSDARTQHMLIIGAYRDNEVTEAHPLLLTVRDLRQAGATINTLTLKPLALAHVQQLTQDTLHCPPAEAHPLAELCLQKTDGNPFFLNQFLRTLYEEKLIEFIHPGSSDDLQLTFDDDDQSKIQNLKPVLSAQRKALVVEVSKIGWRWDIEQIRQAGITDNVVELMTAKIQRLPKKTQTGLRLAACIGNQFDLRTLAIMAETAESELGQDLQPALQEGLLLSSGQNGSSSYQFPHDRIQQAAYSLIADDHKQEVHLKIGRLLLENTLEAERAEKIFDIVNQLNMGQTLLGHRVEQDELAELNLLAGRKAKASAAYEPAFDYLTAGVGLLGENSWQNQYDLTLELYEEAAEVAYLSGDFEQMGQLAGVVLSQAKTLLDKVKVYEVKIEAYKAQHKPLEAIQTALFILRLLGVRFPEKPGKLHILLALLRTKFTLAGKQIEDLSNLPEMTDPTKLAAMRILDRTGPAAYHALPELLPLTTLKQVNLSVKYGNMSLSPHVYAGYGLVLCGPVGDIDAGYRFGQLGLRLLERPNTKEAKAATFFVANCFTRLWKEHVRETLSPLLEAYQSGLETGDLEFASYGVIAHSAYSYFSGRELAGFEREIGSSCEAIRQLKQELALHWIQTFWQVVLNLRGRAENPCRLSGEVYDEEKRLPLYLEANDGTGIFILYLNKLVLDYLFQAYPQALEDAAVAEKYLDGGTGTIYLPVFHFYDSLARLALFPDTPKSQQKRHLKKVAANQKKIKKWAHHAPMNYLHKFYLVEAERTRVLGKDGQAREYYDQAIALARENEYINEEALAYELAGKFYLNRGQDHLATHYLGEAHYAYTRWGAMAKVKDLEDRYPQLLAQTAGREDVSLVAPITTTTSTTGRRTTSALDLTSVVKASQTIAGEIVLDKLLATLMKIVIENAGAQRGCLILEIDGQLMIEAEAQAEVDVEGELGVTVLQSVPIQTAEVFKTSAVSALPISIINYVVRTQESVVLNDAAHEGQFIADPYIKANQPKSILCAPLVNQGQLSGILYLENNLTSGAFTPDRIEVLQILSAQAAVSIKNARLYTGLIQSEQKYRTLFEDSRDAIFITTPAGQMVDVNQAMLNLFGYTRVEIMGLDMRSLYLDPADRLKFQQVIEQAGAVRDFEVRLQKKEGAEMECLLTATVRRADDGQIVAYQGIVRDITARKRQAEAERRLEAYRNSPLGRAEALAEGWLPQPETAWLELHRLAQIAGQDPDVVGLVGHLPQVLENLGAETLAGLAEGFNYCLSSQAAPELLPLALRTLVAHLEQQTWPDAAAALAIYHLSQAALEANSIAQISQLLPRLEEQRSVAALTRAGEQGSDTQEKFSSAPLHPSIPAQTNFTADLTDALAQLYPMAEALHAYERVDTTQDKLAYLASAVERLGHVDRLARISLGSADRPIIQAITASWLAVVTGTMSELQTRAQIVCRLLTRHTWQGEVISLALNLSNEGRGAALNLKAMLVPAPEYTLLDEVAEVERLAPGEEVAVELRIRPRQEGVDQFRTRFVIMYTDPRGPDQVENFADVIYLLAAAGEFQFIPNPYVVGTPLQTGSPLFFGREDQVAFIQENLAATHRNNLVLIGQRRTGKTSLLKQLPAQLGEAYLPVYLDGQTLGLDPGLANFFLNLATEIAFALEDHNLYLDPPEADDFGDSPAAAFERRFLAQVRAAIGDRHLLILLDEFEELETAVQRGDLEASIFGFLRHLIQHTDNLSMIFCGTHRLEELATDYWSILFNISLYRHIAYLERPEALRLIQEPVAEYGLRYDDLALDKMWRVTAGHPYFLQLLCHSLVNRHNQTRRNYVTVADVNAALEEILTAGEAHFIYLWTESSVEERLALTALSRMIPLTGHATPVQVVDYLAERGVNMERRAVSEALHHLALRDILKGSGDLDPALGEAYRWQLGLLGMWVEQYKSLSRVVDEVQL